MWNRETIYIKAVPFINEQHPFMDSIKVQDGRQQIIFNIPDSLQRVYQLIVGGRSMQVNFINDVPEVHIKADFLGNRDSVWGSPATQTLRDFKRSQAKALAKLQSITQSQNAGTKPTLAQTAALQKQYTLVVSDINKAAIRFASKVNNPAVFMAIYNQLDFGHCFQELKSFMTSAVKRFPDYKPIRDLKQETDAYIDIYNHELQIGDVLPYIELPDENNRMYSTKSMQGKYYFIDFWASWCGSCMPYSEPKRQAFKAYAGAKFAMVSVFLDDHKEAWRNINAQEHFVWKQLIDEKQWQGVAVRTIKFDSIPFNYLVSPEGKILAKSIKPNLLLQTLSTQLK
jgi:thiol-disulfide isomerase/thioredoxin